MLRECHTIIIFQHCVHFTTYTVRNKVLHMCAVKYLVPCTLFQVAHKVIIGVFLCCTGWLFAYKLSQYLREIVTPERRKLLQVMGQLLRAMGNFEE